MRVIIINEPHTRRRRLTGKIITQLTISTPPPSLAHPLPYPPGYQVDVAAQWSETIGFYHLQHSSALLSHISCCRNIRLTKSSRTHSWHWNWSQSVCLSSLQCNVHVKHHFGCIFALRPEAKNQQLSRELKPAESPANKYKFNKNWQGRV